jgi:hypothetical protein
MFLANDQDQCLRLLKTITEVPEKSSFLLPAFTPDVGNSKTFLEMYKIINAIPKQHNELVLSLLTKVSELYFCRQLLNIRLKGKVLCSKNAFGHKSLSKR